MSKRKTVIFLGDGMADEPVAELGGRTPLQAADTPGMDRLAREGRCGTLFTLPEPFPTGSEVANMSILGCDLETEYRGRGPLEAMGRGIELGPDDKAFRLNLVTVEDGILRDFSAGHPDQADADVLIDVLNNSFGSECARFHAGVSYRHILVLSGPRFSAEVRTEKPDDHQGEPVADHLPAGGGPGSLPTVEFLRRLIKDAPAVLESVPVNQRKRAAGEPPANGVWPWSGGRAGSMRCLGDKYGVTGAVISAVDVIVGLGRCLGMDIINVPGATGYIDTNYEGKADAAIEALRTHDLVYVHVEAIDEVSHEQNLELKLRTIEDFDSRVVSRVLSSFDSSLNAAVLPDHPVPLNLGKHTRAPVPVAVRMRGVPADPIRVFEEEACARGALGAMTNGDLMALLFG
jgi:2,3-bisphosphoglycerate-independent phosphoglycerate mutase